MVGVCIARLLRAPKNSCSIAAQLASALKLWLSCLPEPLLPADMNNILLQATVYCQGGERLHVLQQVFNHVSLTV